MKLGIDALDQGVSDLNAWIKDVADRLGTEDRRLAYDALRSSLHTLRDRVGKDRAAQMVAEFPLLVRAIFYDGVRRHGPKRAGESTVTLKGDPRGRAMRTAFTGIEEMDDSLQDAAKWINAVEFHLNTRSSQIALAAIEVALQQMRASLPAEEISRLAESLPIPLKGAFFASSRDAESVDERAVQGAREVIEKKIGDLRSAMPVAEAATPAPRQPPARGAKSVGRPRRPEGRPTSSNGSSGSARHAPHRSRS